MSKPLDREFVERRSSVLLNVPAEWEVGRGHYYLLDLKMCQLRTIRYDFKWGSDDVPVPTVLTLVDRPSRVLSLNLSLNDLISLDHEIFLPFRQLRTLDASINRINRIVGLEVLRHLYSLNLSHNFIQQLEGLDKLTSLYELNLSMNELKDISYMPNLLRLTSLYLNSNKLTSLEGIQALPQLRELYVQNNNLTSIVPLSTSFRLVALHAAENNISNLINTVDILKSLSKLQAVSLHGNPIERENHYQSHLIESTTVLTLDNVSVRQPTHAKITHASNISTLKEAARQAFYEQIKIRKQKMEENVRFLQRRILSLQDEYYDFEEKMHRDVEACCSYLDTLSLDDAQLYDQNALREQISTPVPKPWHNNLQYPHPQVRHVDPEPENTLPVTHRPPVDRPDYKQVKDTDEVLRNVYNELSKEQARLNSPEW